MQLLNHNHYDEMNQPNMKEEMNSNYQNKKTDLSSQYRKDVDLLEQVQSTDECVSSVWKEVEVLNLEKRSCWGDATTK